MSSLQTDPEFGAARYLAQLAVNVVDYIDPNHEMTVWNWYQKKDPQTGQVTASDWVIGTELPRLLINEAFVQYDNNPDDFVVGTPLKDQVAKSYFLRVTLELFNPLYFDTNDSDLGDAVLLRGTQPLYQLVVSTEGPDSNGQPKGKVIKTTSDFGKQNQRVKAANTLVKNKLTGQPTWAYSDPTRTNRGFLVLGPGTVDPKTNQTVPPKYVD